MKKLLLILSICLPTALVAQEEAGLYDHKKYLDLLSHSKDSLYSKILSTYDRHIDRHRTAYKVQVERCRFIQNSYYDYSEDYNPNYEKAEQCAIELINRFPRIPEVLLYRAEFLYGDSARVFLKKLEGKIKEDTAIWSRHSWSVYESLAQNYQTDSAFRAIFYASKAMNANDSLDLTLLQGRLYKKNSNYKRAIEVLSSKLSVNQKSWELNQKGRLLLELGATDKAIEAFRLARKDSAGWQDSGSLAQALIEKGLTNEAREYLQKEMSRYDNQNQQALYKLFDYDIKYGSADSARADYKKLTDASFWNDPIGIARIRLLLKSPLAPVGLFDVVRLLLLLLLFAVILAVPYLWILPIHYIGAYVLKKNPASDSEATWSLQQLWIAFSLWLGVEVIALASISYPTVISWFNDSFVEEKVEEISELNAQLTLFFFIGMFLTTLLFFIKWSSVRNLWAAVRLSSVDIWRGIGFAFLLRIPLGIYLAFIKLAGWSDGTLTICSINDSIISINKYFNPWLSFLFVVLLVPIYEEVLFRGVFLSACQKHLNFLIANILQAFTFALAHQNLKLFIFFFGFGLLAGYFRKRTGSFATSIAMHMTNNLIAFLGILWAQRLIF